MIFTLLHALKLLRECWYSVPNGDTHVATRAVTQLLQYFCSTTNANFEKALNLKKSSEEYNVTIEKRRTHGRASATTWQKKAGWKVALQKKSGIGSQIRAK